MTGRHNAIALAAALVLTAAGAAAQVSSGAPAPEAPALEAPVGTAAAPAAPAAPTLPHDLSPWGMVRKADAVVKAVMGGLALASLITWTIGFAKAMQIAGARLSVRRGARALEDCRSLADAVARLGGGRGPVARMIHAAALEARLSEGATDGLKERVASRLDRIEAAWGRRMAMGTGVLATIGSTAPFVGLLGTVWGIMNAFVGISRAQTTNLAVVAPGIAEALLATAIGLVAAIPAVVIYNVFARQIAGYRALLADAAAAIQRLVSRDLGRHRGGRLDAAE